MTNVKKVALCLCATIYVIGSAIFINNAKNNDEAYRKKQEKYFSDYAKYCAAKGETLVKDEHRRIGSRGTEFVTYTARCEKISK